LEQKMQIANCKRCKKMFKKNPWTEELRSAGATRTEGGDIALRISDSPQRKRREGEGVGGGLAAGQHKSVANT